MCVATQFDFVSSIPLKAVGNCMLGNHPPSPLYYMNEMNLKRFIIICYSISIVVMSVHVLFWYPKYFGVKNRISSSTKIQHKHDDSIGILLYNYSPDEIDLHMLDNCSANCHFVKHNQQNQLSEYEYVLFNGPLLQSIPKKFLPQTWIYYSKEAPPLIPRLIQLTNRFNWTMTYRRDSDIYIPWGKFKIKANEYTNLTFHFNERAWSKKKTAVWLVSNCLSQSKRGSFVENMRTKIEVDVFGKCGTPIINCERNRYKNVTCLKEILQKYKFYLAFENALCRDYITEKSFKLYDGLIDVIPIIRGYPSTIGQMLPPGTYVNSNHLDSLINMSVHAAKAYFHNRNLYVHDHYQPCRLCDIARTRIDNSSFKRNLYDNLDYWLYGDKSSPVCMEPNDLY